MAAPRHVKIVYAAHIFLLDSSDLEQFLILCSVDILDWMLLCCECCPAHCRLFNSAPGFHLLDASSNPRHTDTHWHLIAKVSPSIARCSLGGTEITQIENCLCRGHWKSQMCCDGVSSGSGEQGKGPGEVTSKLGPESASGLATGF